MQRNRLLLIACAAVLALVSVWSLWFWATLPGRLPSDDDYRAVNAHLQTNARDGDIAVLAPSWADRGRDFLTAIPVFAGYDLSAEPPPGTRRQWLVALADAPRFSLDEARASLRARSTGSTGSTESADSTGPNTGVRIGALWVEPFDAPGPGKRWQLSESLDRAQVTVGPERCQRRADGRFQCRRGDWNHVMAGWYEVEEWPFHCVWAHPVTGASLRIGVPDVPTGSLHGHAAFVGLSAQRSNVPVHLEARRRGQVVGRWTFESRTGIQPFQSEPVPSLSAADVDVDDDGGVGLELVVTSPDAGARHFCFDAWIE